MTAGVSDAAARAVMARHARSFAPAAGMLGPRDRARIARLYALCRTVDDLADADGSAGAARRLARIETDMRAGTWGDPVACAALALFDARPTGCAAFADLVAGVRTDLRPVRIADMAALEAYAQAVAGTVGLMVADLFDLPVRHHRAASALGRAMQLTNIARDVAEDARADRRYLPATHCPHPPTALIDPTSAVRKDAVHAVNIVLARAERLYAEGRAGLPALPVRLRMAVAVAAALYEGIGLEIAAGRVDPLRARATVPAGRKLLRASGAIRRLAIPASRGATPRESRHA